MEKALRLIRVIMASINFIRIRPGVFFFRLGLLAFLSVAFGYTMCG